eukprot:m.49097 g.49097  ORF g.49097 m.49097 type:complete len:353 (-) comp11447_c0_seq1:25-1083(-)
MDEDDDCVVTQVIKRARPDTELKTTMGASHCSKPSPAAPAAAHAPPPSVSSTAPISLPLGGVVRRADFRVPESERSAFNGDVYSIVLASCRSTCKPNECYLLSGECAMFQQQRSDQRWGCGYRNIQMLCSYLMTSSHVTPALRASLFDGTGFVPSVAAIQDAIEYAWAMGFDREGAAQLGPLRGTHKWIGATEVVSLFRSAGLRMHVADFVSPTHAGLTHHQALIDWIWNYFARDLGTPSSGVLVTEKAPLYLQHQGHSRTVIGINRRRRGGGAGTDWEYFLLILDPLLEPSDLRAALASPTAWAKHIKRGAHTLCKAQYQITFLENLTAMSAIERRASYVITAKETYGDKR